MFSLSRINNKSKNFPSQHLIHRLDVFLYFHSQKHDGILFFFDFVNVSYFDLELYVFKVKFLAKSLSAFDQLLMNDHT